MPTRQALQQRVRARKNTSDDESLPETKEYDKASGNESTSEAKPDEHLQDLEGELSDEELSSQSSISTSSHANEDPSTLSFGALARAQEIVGKRRRSPAEASERFIRLRPDHDSHRPLSQSSKPTRTSKHAPTALSSKHAVTRKREVIAVPKVVARDPRFDPLTGPLNTNRVAQTYSFLSSYQSTEMSQLKSAIRSAKDPAEREMLQKAFKRMESRQKAEKSKEEQQNVVREHRKQEKEKVKEGKQPFYLKKGDLKTKVLEKRFEGMGETKANKVIERRRKKQASREKKALPQRRMGGEEHG